MKKKKRHQHEEYAQNTEPEPQADLDLFLDERKLIALAMRELRGRKPHSHTHAFSVPLAPQQPKTLLARELEARGWSVGDLANAMNIPQGEAAALVRGSARITPAIAEKLGSIFATSSSFWL